MVLTVVGIATTLFKGPLHDTSSILSCLVTLNVAGYMEARSLERDEILSAIEQVRQLCVKTPTERLGKPILDRTCDGVANVTMDEPTRFVRRALARVPAASVDVIDDPRQCCCATASSHGDGIDEPH